MKTTNNGVLREMTAQESAEYDATIAEAVAQADALALKQAARQAVLDKLGLTADEAQALLG